MVSNKRKNLTYLAVFVAGIIVLNILSSFFFTRIDFTSEKRYTLSDITKKELGELDESLQITVYLEGEFPAGFKRLRNATRDLLSDYRSYSNGNLRFDFVNPNQGTEEEQQQVYQELVSKGLEPTNLSVKTEEGLSQKIVFPAALVTYRGQQIPVSLFQNRIGATPEEVLNNSIQNLEYAFTSAIRKVTRGGKPRVGFTEGHGELSDLQLADALSSLQGGYEAGRVNLKDIPFAGLDKLKLLVVPKPDQPFTEAEKYKIDYFLMKGGSIFFALDNVNAELDSLRGMGSQLAFAKKLNLDDMLFRYGIRVNYDLVADMNCAQIPINVGNVSGQAQIQMVPWLFYPIFIPVSKHPLVKNLDGIKSEFASTIDTIAIPGVRKQIILSSSPFNRLLKVPNLISLQMVEQEPDPREFQSQPKPVGALLEGTFPSNFSNRPVPEGISGQGELPGKSAPAKIVVVGDGDILKNQISTQDGSPFPLGYDRYTQQQYGNKNFLLNIADFLTDDSGIIALRNKEVKMRLLDRARVRSEKLTWQFVNIVLPLFLLGAFAIAHHFYRKNKYAK
ncbi:gliding motility-associated ABC transporter substrate-binding protein GldG [Pedobacter sp. SYSU D00535]|uniref:gliding motility-associated ABC transporter substrate-binding protein GldG n=1 Tax=Pedobacter sp. SYSU D00535 TaxID=2810308 RepID=UPI001A96FE14|nr:gliding motility-associated ABC transporter substrate-binding protein GldG [Pedobacter sp. SYSU D00535]